MLRNQAESIHGLGPKPRPQPLDQLRHARAGLAAVHREELGGRFPRLHQRAAAQAKRAHRCGQHEPRQPFAEQLGDSSRCPPPAPRSADADASATLRDGRAAARAPARCSGASAESAQSSSSSGAKAASRRCRVRDLRLEIASRRESLTRDETVARIRPPPDRAIEHVEQARLETPCKTVARQTQAITDRPHAHRGERLEAALGPAGAVERQIREPAREIRADDG